MIRIRFELWCFDNQKSDSKALAKSSSIRHTRLIIGFTVRARSFIERYWIGLPSQKMKPNNHPERREEDTFAEAITFGVGISDTTFIWIGLCSTEFFILWLRGKLYLLNIMLKGQSNVKHNNTCIAGRLGWRVATRKPRGKRIVTVNVVKSPLVYERIQRLDLLRRDVGRKATMRRDNGSRLASWHRPRGSWAPWCMMVPHLSDFVQNQFVLWENKSTDSKWAYVGILRSAWCKGQPWKVTLDEGLALSSLFFSVFGFRRLWTTHRVSESGLSIRQAPSSCGSDLIYDEVRDEDDVGVFPPVADPRPLLIWLGILDAILDRALWLKKVY